MKPNRVRCGIGLVVSLVVAMTASTAPASAEVLSQDPSDVRQFWTDERMDSALPGTDLLADVELPLLPLVEGLLPGGGEPQQRATAQSISSPDRPRIRTHGKVFFTLGGSNYVCSGTVITAENKSVVVTAGHCVYGLGQFATNWMFVPAKDGGSEPYGRWAAVELDTTSQWQGSEDIRFDVGMATLERRNGRPIQKRIGARRIAFNKGRNLTFNAFGYPAEGRFNGQYLYRCKSPAQGTDSGPRPKPTRIDCDMTGGSSGGGWVISKGRVNSVVSYGYECPVIIIIQFPCNNTEEGKLFGPYFGNEVRQLYRTTQRR